MRLQVLRGNLDLDAAPFGTERAKLYRSTPALHFRATLVQPELERGFSQQVFKPGELL